MPASRKQTDFAWAAGFFDGEGSTCAAKQSRTGRDFLVLAAPQKDPRVLERFLSIFGVGKIYGPYFRKPHQRGTVIYHFQAHQENARKILKLMWPYLGEMKREQAQAAIDRVDSQPIYIPPVAQHGIYSKYTLGCRCNDCRVAARKYVQARRDSIKAGTWTFRR